MITFLFLLKLDRHNFKKTVNRNIDHIQDYIVESFTSLVHQAATKTIRKSNIIMRKPPVPWWNDEVQNAINAKNVAYRYFKRCPSQINFISK